MIIYCDNPPGCTERSCAACQSSFAGQLTKDCDPDKDCVVQCWGAFACEHLVLNGPGANHLLQVHCGGGVHACSRMKINAENARMAHVICDARAGADWICGGFSNPGDAERFTIRCPQRVVVPAKVLR